MPDFNMHSQYVPFHEGRWSLLATWQELAANPFTVCVCDGRTLSTEASFSRRSFDQAYRKAITYMNRVLVKEKRRSERSSAKALTLPAVVLE